MLRYLFLFYTFYDFITFLKEMSLRYSFIILNILALSFCIVSSRLSLQNKYPRVYPIKGFSLPTPNPSQQGKQKDIQYFG